MQEKLWQGLKAATDTAVSSLVGIWHLQRVVAKKRDPLSHVCFLDVLLEDDKPLLTDRLWHDVLKALHDVCASLMKPARGGVVREVLVHSYPKFAAILEAGFERLLQDTALKGTLPAVFAEQREELLEAAGPLQGAYLASSLQRMSDAVVAAFPGGSR